MSSQPSGRAEPAQVPEQLAFIGGSGRSGSTMLDLLLGNSPYVQSTGEIMRLSLYARTAQPCTCGALLQDCEFWSRVQAEGQ